MMQAVIFHNASEIAVEQYANKGLKPGAYEIHD
jgi:hypothetical protein